jgi:hypothetical protein
MIEALILGYVLNILTCLVIVCMDKRGYEFFELTVIPYAVPILVLGYTAWERVTGL